MAQTIGKEDYWIRRITLAMVLGVSLLLVLSLVAQSYRTLMLFDREITPDLGQKAQAVARTIGAQVERLAAVGNPLDRLNGLPEYVRQVAGPHPEIARVTLQDAGRQAVQVVELRPAGEIIQTASPVTVAGQVVGHVAVGYDAIIVRNAFADIIYDILTTLLVAALLAFELVLVVVTTGVAEPIRQLSRVLVQARDGSFQHLLGKAGIREIRHLGQSIDGTVMDLYNRYQAVMDKARALGHQLPEEAGSLLERLRARLDIQGGGPRPILTIIAEDIRLPLFVFFLSTELSRSFMPLFAQQVYEPILGLPREIAITLPIAGYMAFSAIATPYAGTLVERFGVRRVFIGGLIPSFIAYVMVALSHSLTELILWRCIGAVGAAGVTIAALGHIAMFSRATSRASAMAIYSGTFIAAGVCGSSIGGILADRLGFAFTFVISAALTLASALIILHLLDRAVDQHTLPKKRTRWRDVGQVMAQPAFATLVLGVAIPAGVVTMGHLFFTMPLLLSSLGETQSSIGRYIMLYFITMILLSHFAARLADRTGNHHAFITVGIISMALAPLLISLSQTPLAISASIVCVGIGNALCTPAQGAVLLQISDSKAHAGTQHTVAIAVFRVLERIGLVLGPIVAAALASSFGQIDTARAMGIYTLLSAGLFIVHALSTGKLGRRAGLGVQP